MLVLHLCLANSMGMDNVSGAANVVRQAATAGGHGVDGLSLITSLGTF